MARHGTIGSVRGGLVQAVKCAVHSKCSTVCTVCSVHCAVCALYIEQCSVTVCSVKRAVFSDNV